MMGQIAKLLGVMLTRGRTRCGWLTNRARVFSQLGHRSIVWGAVLPGVSQSLYISGFITRLSNSAPPREITHEPARAGAGGEVQVRLRGPPFPRSGGA